MEKCVSFGKMGYTEKNDDTWKSGSQLEKRVTLQNWVALRKTAHPWKKRVTLGKIGHTWKNG